MEMRKRKTQLMPLENMPGSRVSFPCGSVVKHSPVSQEPQEMWVQSLGQEYPLEEGMATHSSILAWRVPWTEEAGGYGPWDRRVGRD